MSIRDIRPIWYFVFLILLLVGFYFLYGRELPQESSMVINKTNEPGREQLFVPIKLDSAKAIFAQPVILPESKLKIISTKDQLTIQGDALEEVLDRISMRSAMLKDLQKYDALLSVSEDHKTLKLGIYKDEKTGMKYVNVPAGFLRAFIK